MGGLLSSFGDSFAAIIGNGVNTLLPIAHNIAFSMMVLGAMLVGRAIAFNHSGLIQNSFKLILCAGFYMLLIDNVQAIGEGILTSAVQIGLRAAGSGQNPEAFLRSPDALVYAGLSKAADLRDLAQQACDTSSWGCVGVADVWLSLWFSKWIILLACWFGGFLILSSLILFKMALLAGMILLPLGMFEITSSFGFMPIRAIVHLAVQLMVLTVISAVGLMVISKMVITAGPGDTPSIPFIIAGLTFFGLILGSSRLAASLVSGALATAGSLLAAPAGMAAAGMRSAAGHLDAPLTAGAKMGARGAMAGAAAAGRGAMSLAARVQSAAASRLGAS